MASSKPLTQENAAVELEEKLGGLVVRKATPQYIGAFMALYSQGGAGKTTLASSLYEVGKTLLIDAEGGSDSIEDLADEPNLDIVDISDYKQFKRLCDAIERKPDLYDNYIVDNLCEIVDLCENDFGIIGNDSHDLSKYKLVTREIIRKIKMFRSLCRTHGKNVVICAWDADEKDSRGVLKKDLAFSPSLRKEFPGILTIIGHIDVTSDPDKRVLDFSPSPKSVSKFKRSRNSNAQKVPYRIPYTVDNLPLVDVLNTIKKGTEWPAKKYKASDEKE